MRSGTASRALLVLLMLFWIGCEEDSTDPDAGRQDTEPIDIGEATPDVGFGRDATGLDAASADRTPADSGPPTDPWILYEDELDQLGRWQLLTDTGAGGDRARAEVLGGKLIVSAEQELGCPTATATLILAELTPIEAPFRATEIIIHVDRLSFTPMAQGIMTLTYPPHRVRLDLTPFTASSSTTFTVRSGDEESVTQDGSNVLMTFYERKEATNEAVGISIGVRACGADGNHSAEAVLESVLIQARL